MRHWILVLLLLLLSSPSFADSPLWQQFQLQTWLARELNQLPGSRIELTKKLSPNLSARDRLALEKALTAVSKLKSTHVQLSSVLDSLVFASPQMFLVIRKHPTLNHALLLNNEHVIKYNPKDISKSIRAHFKGPNPVAWRWPSLVEAAVAEGKATKTAYPHKRDVLNAAADVTEMAALAQAGVKFSLVSVDDDIFEMMKDVGLMGKRVIAHEKNKNMGTIVCAADGSSVSGIVWFNWQAVPFQYKDQSLQLTLPKSPPKTHTLKFSQLKKRNFKVDQQDLLLNSRRLSVDGQSNESCEEGEFVFCRFIRVEYFLTPTNCKGCDMQSVVADFIESTGEKGSGGASPAPVDTEQEEGILRSLAKATLFGSALKLCCAEAQCRDNLRSDYNLDVKIDSQSKGTP